LKAEFNVVANVHGGQSRNARNKSLRFKMFDSQNLEMFKNYEDISNFILRNSGNDANITLLRDGSVQTVCSNMKFEKQRYQPSIVFLNGEYNGILNLRDRLDNDFLSLKYNLDKIHLEIGDNQTIDNSSGDYESLTNFVKSNNFSNNSNYEYLKSKVEIDEFIDYTIVQSYFGNIDALSNNYGYWRFKGLKDCESCVKNNKWRFLLFALDYGYTESQLPFSIFYQEAGDNYFYRYIKNNPNFRISFVNRYADLLNSNFRPTYINSTIDSLKDVLSPEITYHFARWDQFGINNWSENINNFKNFAVNRPSSVLNSIRSEFSILGTFDITVSSFDIQSGHVRVNSLQITESTPGVTEQVYPWVGTYFDNIPITLSAIPRIGFKFSHWIHNSQIIYDSTISVTTSTNKEYTAFFEELILSDYPQPLVKNLTNCSYKLKSWSSSNTINVHPENMKFVYFEDTDPSVNSKIAGFTSGVFNHTSRTRINGQNELGFSFINTTGSAVNVGYPIGKLGGAILAMNTIGLDSIKLSFKTRTISPGSRKYGIRLQYREGDIRDFSNFTENVDYQGNVAAGDSLEFKNIKLPMDLLQKPYIQLLWRYYYTGIGTSGNRDHLATDDIIVETYISRYGDSNNLTSAVEKPSIIESLEKLISNNNVNYKAENSIILKPGFFVNSGNIFEAKVSGCDY
jgi:hypothetical protein